ncbi:Fasciclin-like arabinogalactan protein 7 [Acorus calamus]|uniref:Fasciclin-like arabinogalactan protein 7 n=1 Tax=Acorus calamus TaxID=4465 RepID=A0AAV9D9H4_ACOCL|nr:Fasciclin-like arabinogalactan protein 7 [Acorus calamus]
MAFPKILIVTTLLALSLTSINAATILSPTPAPAPAPGPGFVNLTDLFTVAGPFQTFLQLLQQTKVIETFQNQANNTDQGITIFVPKDKAFSSLKKPSLKNLTSDQLKSLLLFHAIPKYYKLSEFTTLSSSSPVSTIAGGQYTLNFTDNSGSIKVNSGWANTKISSSVYSTDPVAVYQVDKVLLPQVIFGVAPPQAPAPAPVPEASPVSDISPSSHVKGSSPKSSDSTSSSSSHRISFGIVNWLALVVASAGLMVLF